MEQRGEVSDRCEYNRIIRQLNYVTKEWHYTMKALHQMVMQKVRVQNRCPVDIGFARTGTEWRQE